MRYGIEFSDNSLEQLDSIRQYDRAIIFDAIETHLRHEPRKESKSRIKALRGMLHPQYRLRIYNYRIFYDVSEATVEIIAVVTKADAIEWLETSGTKSF
ncbi:MAG: type II toxin-antitoxin system RelE/ParE family toxin [Candidatus Sumerlaeota bacterium]|nr:type II toxin-antitoxin system RelE/ParE family toxin [Candidatus Sumerlaeota bacterium]